MLENRKMVVTSSAHGIKTHTMHCDLIISYTIGPVLYDDEAKQRYFC